MVRRFFLPPSPYGEGQTMQSIVRAGNADAGEILQAAHFPTLAASQPVHPQKGEGGARF
jgi:hypothetical protein